MSCTEAINRWPASWALARSAVSVSRLASNHFDVGHDAGTISGRWPDPWRGVRW